MPNETSALNLDEVTRGAVDLHSREQLEELLAAGRPLKIKAGFDPTAPDLHLGHTVVLARMKRFQALGHRAIFVIGDYTARIGDPTGKNATRPPLEEEAIRRNASTFEAQVKKVLDPELTEIRFNSEWLEPLGASGIIKLAAHYTVARMLERDDFKKRYKAGIPISIHEFLYPLLQGYDSVALEADVELGGTDQLFNLLVGRELMRDHGQRPQVVMTSPLLEGTEGRLVDGKLVGEKMSKSLGNYVGIDEPPEEIFGKLMSITDDLMWRYYELLSDRSTAEIAAEKQAVAEGSLHPKSAKEALAREMVVRYHGEEAGEAAAAHFARVHTNRGLPEEIPEGAYTFPPEGASLAGMIADLGLAGSRSEARRLIKGGGVKVDGEKVADPQAELSSGEYLLQVGKRKFFRVQPK
ncbi:MAG: tyrosine--tRNA ligase [Deltaproteobacteria bacterium]|nr:tyrosine--tRNA ligase [Deltaproteobacteria bacterium]